MMAVGRPAGLGARQKTPMLPYVEPASKNLRPGLVDEPDRLAFVAEIQLERPRAPPARWVACRAACSAFPPVAPTPGRASARGRARGANLMVTRKGGVPGGAPAGATAPRPRAVVGAVTVAVGPRRSPPNPSKRASTFVANDEVRGSASRSAPSVVWPRQLNSARRASSCQYAWKVGKRLTISWRGGLPSCSQRARRRRRRPARPRRASAGGGDPVVCPARSARKAGAISVDAYHDAFGVRRHITRTTARSSERDRISK